VDIRELGRYSRLGSNDLPISSHAISSVRRLCPRLLAGRIIEHNLATLRWTAVRGLEFTEMLASREMNNRDAAMEPVAAGDMTREKALSRAQALVPFLQERSDECVQDRRVPDKTIHDFMRSGLLRLLQPKKYGGHEMGWDVFCEVIQILASGCGSQGWVYRVLGDHAQMIGIFPEAAQEEVWGDNQDAIASSSFAPVGKAVSVKNGVRFSGQHRFSSGIDHAQWVICGGLLETSSGKHQPNYFLVRKDEGSVIDDWYVNGLGGTGSKGFEIEEVFIPNHRILNWVEASHGKGPGGKIHSAPIFRLPRGGYTTSGFSALAVGMAQGMLSDWLSLTATRRSEGKPMSPLESTQIIAAAAASEISAAEALYLTTIQHAMRDLEAEGSLPLSRTAVTRAHMAQACQLVLKAVNRLHETMGSSAVYSGSSIERQYRDIQVGLQHIGVNWPRAASAYGIQLFREHGADLPEASIND
jgi:3-hydroxy-9,10-secoandrosta-1,3,5(10)-triene-9,17-dione monooxygenase